jgi:agmatine deiminase
MPPTSTRPTARPASQTPARAGFTFPPEFAPQCATWLSWPRPEGISFPSKYHTVPENLARIIAAIANRQDVHINVLNDNWARLVRDQLRAGGVSAKMLPSDASFEAIASGKKKKPIASQRVFFHFIKTNECWCRDHGPAFLVKGQAKGPGGPFAGKQVAVVDFGFNAWGGKYPPFGDDDAVPTQIAKRSKLTLFTHAAVMEGGSVEFSGEGTILSTTQCLLNKNRNPKLSKEAIEKILLDFYGQKQVLWLSEGIEGDDTDGHVDDLVRFLDPQTIVIGVETNPKDANYRQLQRARKKLDALRDTSGEAFEIVEIPMPSPVMHDGERLPATYINFLFIDGACLVPTFGVKQDATALKILQQHLPRHQVIGIDCRELIWGLGAIHCLSQQVPKVPGLKEKLRASADV